MKKYFEVQMAILKTVLVEAETEEEAQDVAFENESNQLEVDILSVSKPITGEEEIARARRWADEVL